MASIVKLNDTTDIKLREMLENAREEMFNLRFQQASARLDDIARLRTVRRDIAQMETVLHLRQMALDRAAGRPEVAEAIAGKEWHANARFQYEESAWNVTFLDDKDKQIATATVDLNKKQARGRKAVRAAK